MIKMFKNEYIDEEAKKTYSQEELDKIQETVKEISNQYPGIKTLPVDNIISKKMNMKFDTPPVLKDGRTLIPVRAISEGFGAKTTLDVPAETMNNRTIVPLRFVAESLGIKVN